MPDRASRVGVIGLGAMGLGTARALLDAGFAVFGCDVSPAACRALSESGGQVCDTPAELGAQVNIVITLVVNAAQVEAVLLGADGAVQNLTAGALVLQCSTVPVRQTSGGGSGRTWNTFAGCPRQRRHRKGT